MIQKITELLKRMNERGIYLPLAYDRDKGRGSNTLTMFWVSFIVGVVLLSGKAMKMFGEVDYNNALLLIGLSGSFYLGKDYMSNGKQQSISNKNKSEDNQAEPPV